MAGLIPWRRKRNEATVDSGAHAPLRDFSALMGQMQSAFDDLFDRYARNWPDFGEGWRWGLDVEDQEDKVVVRAEAPGFDAGDFDLRVQDGRLVLRASKKAETKDAKGKTERYQEQECFESVALPTGVDKEKVDASYKNGVLTVTLPKTATGKAKKIAVKAS